jgi:signal transduction histidine kinase
MSATPTEWLARHQRVNVVVPPLVLTLTSIVISSWRGSAWQGPQWTEVALVAVICAPLTFRFRWPILMAIVVIGIEIGYILTLRHLYFELPIVGMVALCLMAIRSDRLSAWIVGGAAIAAIITAIRYKHLGPTLTITNVAIIDGTLVAVVLGRAIGHRKAALADARERAAYFERSREEEAERRVTEERVRIARDLHDVVAHHITLVNAQAGVAHHLFRNDPEKALRALESIKDTSRAALDQIRATVGLLRQPGDGAESTGPTPDLTNLDDLLENFAKAGQSVGVAKMGNVRALDAITELTAYRIIQEALTNVHKHATVKHADVTLDFQADSLRVAIFNAAVDRGTVANVGHGLIGMHERANAIGGTLAAGFRTEGGFEVVAVLPIRDTVVS